MHGEWTHKLCCGFFRYSYRDMCPIVCRKEEVPGCRVVNAFCADQKGIDSSREVKRRAQAPPGNCIQNPNNLHSRVTMRLIMINAKAILSVGNMLRLIATNIVAYTM